MNQNTELYNQIFDFYAGRLKTKDFLKAMRQGAKISKIAYDSYIAPENMSPEEIDFMVMCFRKSLTSMINKEGPRRKSRYLCNLIFAHSFHKKYITEIMPKELFWLYSFYFKNIRIGKRNFLKATYKPLVLSLIRIDLIQKYPRCYKFLISK